MAYTRRERSSYADPRQYSEGMPHVFVKDQPVIASGRCTGARPGQLGRHTV